MQDETSPLTVDEPSTAAPCPDGVLATEHAGIITLKPGYRWWRSAVRKQVLGLAAFALIWDTVVAIFTVVWVFLGGEVPLFMWLFMVPFYAVGVGMPLSAARMAWREDHVQIGRGLYRWRRVVWRLPLRRHELALDAITAVAVAGAGEKTRVEVTAGRNRHLIERLAPPDQAEALRLYLIQCIQQARGVEPGGPR